MTATRKNRRWWRRYETPTRRGERRMFALRLWEMEASKHANPWWGISAEGKALLEEITADPWAWVERRRAQA